MIEIETKQELAFALLWIAWELLVSKGMRFVAELTAFSETGQWTAINVKIAYLRISDEGSKFSKFTDSANTFAKHL